TVGLARMPMSAGCGTARRTMPTAHARASVRARAALRRDRRQHRAREPIEITHALSLGPRADRAGQLRPLAAADELGERPPRDHARQAMAMDIEARDERAQRRDGAL